MNYLFLGSLSWMKIEQWSFEAHDSILLELFHFGKDLKLK